MDNNQIGKTLKYLRNNSGKTQKEVAQFLGISRPAYTLYETGVNVPPRENLEKLASFFNVPLDYFTAKDVEMDIDVELLTNVFIKSLLYLSKNNANSWRSLDTLEGSSDFKSKIGFKLDGATVLKGYYLLKRTYLAIVVKTTNETKPFAVYYTDLEPNGEDKSKSEDYIRKTTLHRVLGMDKINFIDDLDVQTSIQELMDAIENDPLKKKAELLENFIKELKAEDQ